MQLLDLAAWRAVGRDLASMARWGEVLRLVAERLDSSGIEDLIDLLRRPSRTDTRTDADRLILVGQCIADSGIVPKSLVVDVFQQLLNLATSANRPGYTSDAIIVAARLLKVYASLQQSFNSLLTQQEQSHHWYILMQILGLSGTADGNAQLHTMLQSGLVLSSPHSEETMLSIGATAQALVASRSSEAGAELLRVMLVSKWSYLRGVGASCLAKFKPPTEVQHLLEEVQTEQISLSIEVLYVLTSCLDEDELRQLCDFVKQMDPTRRVQLRFNEFVSQDGVIDSLGDLGWSVDERLAQEFRLVDATVESIHGQVLDSLRSISTSDKYELNERCAAAYNLVRAVPRLCNEVLVLVEGSVDLQLAVLASLAESKSVVSLDFELLDTSDLRVMDATIRTLGSAPSPTGRQWLESLYGSDRRLPDEVHLELVVALARNGSTTVLKEAAYTLKHGNAESGQASMIRALSVLGTAEAEEAIVDLTHRCTDIGIISECVSALGHLGSGHSERVLVSLLNVANWPKSWPARLPPLAQGEQRPSDNRLELIIGAVGRRRVLNALPALDSIVSSEEIEYVRYLAGGVARSIRRQFQKNLPRLTSMLLSPRIG